MISYRTRIYIAMDYDADKNYYNTLKMWNENNYIDFDFSNSHDLNSIWFGSSDETIYKRLRERMNKSKILVLLIGDLTKNKHKFVGWEIELALKNKLPIICVNLNKVKGYDSNNCPTKLKNQLAIHIPFQKNILKHSLNNWGNIHEQLIKDGGNHSPREWNQGIYSQVERQ